MLVYVRPSNEALLRARVPGAQDQRGCPSNPFHRARSASKKDGLAIPAYPFQARSFLSPAGGPIGLLLRASNEHILIVRVARARETNGLPDSLNPPFLPHPNL
jgi:hypothetical protein